MAKIAAMMPEKAATRRTERDRQRDRLKAKWAQAEYREYTVAAAVEGLLASRRRMLLEGPSPDRERIDADAAAAAGIKVPEGARPVALTRGAVALVDVGDYEAVATFRWVAMFSSGHCYAARAHQRSIGEIRASRTSHVWMHRFILKPPSGMMVDHINGDGLDNRRANLRVCNHFQNAQNRGPTAGCRQYKGAFPTPTGRWQAFIGAFGVRHYLGTFDTEIEAATAYDRAALRFHKEFARLNFPESSGHAEDA